LYEFENVLDVTYGAYAISGAHGGINNSGNSSSQAPARNRVEAVIREMPDDEIAVVRQNARDAGNAVSTIQIFTDAIETVAEKLMRILELAKEAVELYYPHLRAGDIKQEFRNLAEEINRTVNDTEYNYNKPFAADGKTFTIPIGNELTIDIPAKDFRFDAEDIDITANPQNALSAVKEAIKSIDEYKTYLGKQAAHLKDITVAFELEIQSAIGVDMQDFQAELAVPMADYAASLISKNKQKSLNTQANLSSDEILKLLKAA
jgi:flagellin-like hook-associated protein FlgL